jgi:tartrate/fumarate subfamily iron-sulfur-dependent hydro-lyase alpha chain
VLSSGKIADAVRAAIPLAAASLRPDALVAMRAALSSERSPRGRAVLAQLLENADLAARDHVPLCQDTGTVWVRVELASDECVCGDLQAEIDIAVAEAYRDAHLRMSVVRDALLDRDNTRDNTPAFVEVALGTRAGTGATVHVMLKGGGSDNASALEMLPPSAGMDGVREFVIRAVESKATGACPPLLIGVAVGGTFDTVACLAKKALLRRIGTPAASAVAARAEADLLDVVNATGIGPGGLGGRTTALAVHLVTAPCHIAALPVAVNMGCCAVRSSVVEVA